MKRLAELGVETFFTQVFKHNFFHADMHAGNIFVSTENPDLPGYIAVDFGICGSLSKNDQQYIAQSIYAFFHGDYRRVAELHIASGWVAPNTRLDELEGVIRSLCEPILRRPFKDIHFSQILMRLFEIAQRFELQVQPQLVLLQKTLMQIEGLGRELYPDLDLWATAEPFMERWMHDQIGMRGLFNRFKQNLPELVEALPDLPIALDKGLRALQRLDNLTLPDARSRNSPGRGERGIPVFAAGTLFGGSLMLWQSQPELPLAIPALAFLSALWLISRR
jgi:ubiquinone biosynthesis protein